GEAIVRLLEGYGVDTVFGIPGVHTLELYRGLGDSSIRHIQPRNEMGGGFMADGYARASGRPGVCFVITGPGVTNLATPMGQAYADSVPMLVISSSPPAETLGKGWGMLHEISDQVAVTEPITAFSATAMKPDEVPNLVARAFEVFATGRPRPVHITIPLDVLAMEAGDGWGVAHPKAPAQPAREAIVRAAELLTGASSPLIYIGSGARGCGDDLLAIAERLQAAVVTTNGGKGVISDDHPLNLGTTVIRQTVHRAMNAADVVLAIGTEMGHTDHFAGPKLSLTGAIIRIDIDPAKIDDLYAAEIGIVADARLAAGELRSALEVAEQHPSREGAVAEIRSAAMSDLGYRERQHLHLLGAIRRAVPHDAITYVDMTQLGYTGSWGFPVYDERQWLYPAGFCTLGPALPGAIGAKLAMPDKPVMAFVGDGGFMFTVQELITGAELGLPIPIILWNNEGYQQIRGDMKKMDIAQIGVSGITPHFMQLAASMRCHGVQPSNAEELAAALRAAFSADRPTIIEIHEGADWLLS
ncbi:MAG: 5-guanidino-2-oxopentanoate decarboxylase, partial [Acidimicrobiia bacterium]|nr:5-guanidino-2-oxopentanoate decarboxylase [Acidimicrobiia bacterium]